MSDKSDILKKLDSYADYAKTYQEKKKTDEKKDDDNQEEIKQKIGRVSFQIFHSNLIF